MVEYWVLEVEVENKHYFQGEFQQRIEVVVE